MPDALPQCTAQNAGQIIVVGDDLLRCEGNAWRRVTDGALFVEFDGDIAILTDADQVAEAAQDAQDASAAQAAPAEAEHEVEPGPTASA